MRVPPCNAQMIAQLAPQVGVAPMRCVLAHLDRWDPSTHALLGLKHILMALKCVRACSAPHSSAPSLSSPRCWRLRRGDGPAA